MECFILNRSMGSYINCCWQNELPFCVVWINAIFIMQCNVGNLPTVFFVLATSIALPSIHLSVGNVKHCLTSGSKRKRRVYQLQRMSGACDDDNDDDDYHYYHYYHYHYYYHYLDHYHYRCHYYHHRYHFYYHDHHNHHYHCYHHYYHYCYHIIIIIVIIIIIIIPW